MTIGLGIKVPGQGCVLACDSRVLCGNDIVTDTCDKFVLAGSAVAVVAGHDGALMDHLQLCKSFDELYNTALEYTQDKPLNWDLLIFDRKTDQLVFLDNHGSLLRVGNGYAIGCGSGFAMGVLDALPKISTLEAAKKAADKAVRCAIRRNAACGGRVRLLVVPAGRKAPVQVR